jgi:23S rRNA pseudouridine1911/1915/1917 synthase
LDRFIAERIGTISRARVKGLILEHAVQRGGAVLADVSAAVREGDVFTLVLPPAAPARPLGQAIALDVVYEDAELIVLNKPAGLVVHPAPGNPDGTLVNALIAHCGAGLTGIGGEQRPGIVHRLDKDTSGLMVAAKTELAHTRLCADFAARRIERAYLAVCWGVPKPAAGDIEGAIGRDPRERKRMAVVSHGGKNALTHYKTVLNFSGAALLSCRLATGRTHQIRVHFAHIGHPLLGDPLYLRRRPAAAALLEAPARALALDFPRQALHAQTLGFSHPISGQTLHFQAAPPADFQQLTDALAAGQPLKHAV